MAGKIVLHAVTGRFAGKEFAFEAHDAFLFGRHSQCHAHLPKDRLMSRHHFLLEVNPPDVALRDLGSLNGTYVNGIKHGGRDPQETPEQGALRQHPEVALKDGDLVTVGQNTLQVRVVPPEYCTGCGAAISEDAVLGIGATGGGSLCAACRQQGTKTAVMATAVEVLACQHCGKDVSAEVGNRRRGEYCCRNCREALIRSDGGLKDLMQEAVSRARGDALAGIEGYEMGAPLGKGGMGVVYLAHRIQDRQPVAVKVMLSRIAVDEEARHLFLREIDVLRQLRHPNIASLLHMGAAGSVFYFVMEYCQGGSLAQLLSREAGRLSLATAAPMMLDCLRGLEHAHELNFVHRDLKPQNILLAKESDRLVARLADFGLAKSLERAGISGMTATGSFRGTYKFMPREQLTHFKYVQAASDVWSLAATFYYVLTGQCPLDFPTGRDPAEVILEENPVAIRDRDSRIPASLARVLDKALEVDVDVRYPDARAFRLALEPTLK